MSFVFLVGIRHDHRPACSVELEDRVLQAHHLHTRGRVELMIPVVCELGAHEIVEYHARVRERDRLAAARALKHEVLREDTREHVPDPVRVVIRCMHETEVSCLVKSAHKTE
jgi:hypothetical protein